ncbi:hypothetical protein A3L12_01345 [Thermococcus sp. P6]|uniref:hypothetical protein n=1 Tax=Thermococcus sp. P6 TaxID=122420 RepID=UPI000B59E1EB|nr:hypothetical protein [Thermococcus sp. P6]ASJ10038.1 hypothetical protein A3L12_01345 [Thermococcus sp. P6]
MKIYFWSKSATKPSKSTKDILNSKEVTVEEDIYSLLRALEKKIEVWRDFENDVEPENSSVKKWIKKIMDSYPNKRDDEVEYLIDTFRASLNTKSKEADKFIVGVLQMKDVLVIVHSRKDPSLAEIEEGLYSVRVVLHPKNIIRADIIKRTQKDVLFAAFEYSKRLSKGHAKFWGIEPEEVGWESLGSIKLNIELDTFSFPILLPIEQDDLKELIGTGVISTTGKIKIGKDEGRITKVFVRNKAYNYNEFYDMFVAWTEKLNSYKKEFMKIVPSQTNLMTYYSNIRYQYTEDEVYLYKVTENSEERLFKKEHPNYTICFCTTARPGIHPKRGFLIKLYNSIFNGNGELIRVWHAGEETTLEPFKLGNLEIYNKVEVPEEILDFSNNLMMQIQDAQSRKGRLLMEYLLCKVYSENIKNGHLKSMFEFIMDDILIEEIKYEFRHPGNLQKEDILEFKSADDSILRKPARFTEKKLVPTIKKYLDGPTRRYCITYGIEDDSTIAPIRHLKNDMITEIEKRANKQLSNESVKIHILPIPHNGGVVLAVYMIPKYGGD